jgi:hypothetical protein
MPWTWLNKVIKNQSIFYLSVIEKRLAASDSAGLLT